MGDPVALVVEPGVGIGVAVGGAAWSVAGVDVGPAVPPLSVVAAVEAALRPRWVLWSAKTALILARAGIRVALAWDLAAVHRLLFGGWLADAGRVWAAAHGLALEGVPAARPADLFSSLDDVGGDQGDPVRTDGYLRAEWAAGAWAESPERLGRWAAFGRGRSGPAVGASGGHHRSAAGHSHGPVGVGRRAVVRGDDRGWSADGSRRGGVDHRRLRRSPTAR